MTKKSKTPAVAVSVPQNQSEACAAVAQIGVLNRQVARIEADMNDEMAKLKAAAEDVATPVKVQIAGLTEGVKVWAEANRRALTQDDKVKFADLGTGRIAWRQRPPAVSIRKLEAVIEALKRLGLQRFLRTKEEVNKEAMLAEPDVARTVPGVSIGSAGEDFIVEPFEADLSAPRVA